MAEKPNILIIMVDQWRADALGAAGHPLVQTPALDRLAAEGVRFENAFTPCPLCTPARASFYTGLYPHAHGAIVNDMATHDGVKFLPEYLREAGYRTFHAGKWHIGPENDQPPCFDQTVTAHGDYYAFLRERGIDWTTGSSSRRLMFHPDSPHEGRFEHGVENTRPRFLLDATAAFIDEAAAQDDPFFAVCSFYGPHAPYDVPDPYYGMYDPEAITLPESFFEDWSDKPIVLRAWDPGKWQRDWPETKWRKVMAGYFAMLTHIDAEIGRLLDALEASGAAENTLVVFLSDHGEMNGSHRFLYKGPYFFEEVLRMPVIVRWPGTAAKGQVNPAMISLLDVFATALESAGLPRPQNSHSQSLVPLLNGGSETHRKAIYSELYDFAYGAEPLWAPMRCYRDANWKYVERLPVGPDGEELYNLQDDPGELHNRARDAAFSAVRIAYHEKLRAVSASFSDPWPEIVPLG